MNKFWCDWITFTKQPKPSPAFSLTLLPNEIWLHIFLLAACDRTGTPHPRYLHAICSVCHHWRITCTTYPPLWTVLPYSMHWVFGDRPRHKLKAGISRTRMYIARSGKTLPLTVHLRVNEETWTKNLDLAHEFLQILVAECHRWETVHFYIPGEAFDLLAPIQGHLPILRTLEIDTAERRVWPDHRRWEVDCFSDAPALRELRLNFHNSYWGLDLRVKLALPRMTQLERYDAPGYHSEPYQELINNPSPHLRSLTCPDATPALVPTTSPLTLPRLENLDLSCVKETAASSYLDTLVLPALKILILGEAWGLHQPSVDPSSSVLGLIRRSGCSLHHLAMNGTDFESSRLGDVFALCDDLAQLDLRRPTMRLLEHLVLDPKSPFPVLPKLERVNFLEYEGMLDGAGEVLGRMVRSRTTDLAVHTCARETQQQHELSLSFLQPLKFVEFLSADFMHRELPLLELLVETDEEDVVLGALSSRVGGVLRHHLMYSGGAATGLNVGFHVEMDGVLRELETLEFGQGGSCWPLLWRGIPNALCAISKRKSPQITMGERIFRVQYRAANLVKKWRPFLMRDVQTLPFSWNHDDDGAIRLAFNYDWEGIDAEDDFWDEILGIAPWSSSFDAPH